MPCPHLSIRVRLRYGPVVRLSGPRRGGVTSPSPSSPIYAMAAYRQRALACAAALAQGPRLLRDLKADIPDAPKILRGNVYGWFVPVERGIYTLAESGRAALLRWPQSAAPTAVH